MKLISIISTLAAISSGLSFTALASVPSIEIESLVANGSGCPGVNPSYETTDSEIIVSLGDWGTALENGEVVTRDNCQTTISIAKPAGWSYRVGMVSYQVSSNVWNANTATVETTLYEQGSASTLRDELSFSYYVGSFQMQSYFDYEASCSEDRALNVMTSLRIISQSDYSTYASLEQTGDLSIELEWFSCE